MSVIIDTTANGYFHGFRSVLITSEFHHSNLITIPAIQISRSIQVKRSYFLVVQLPHKTNMDTQVTMYGSTIQAQVYTKWHRCPSRVSGITIEAHLWKLIIILFNSLFTKFSGWWRADLKKEITSLLGKRGPEERLAVGAAMLCWTGVGIGKRGPNFIFPFRLKWNNLDYLDLERAEVLEEFYTKFL